LSLQAHCIFQRDDYVFVASNTFHSDHCPCFSLDKTESVLIETIMFLCILNFPHNLFLVIELIWFPKKKKNGLEHILKCHDINTFPHSNHKSIIKLLLCSRRNLQALTQQLKQLNILLLVCQKKQPHQILIYSTVIITTSSNTTIQNFNTVYRLQDYKTMC